MSCFAQEHKWQVDRAIHRACVQLASDPAVFHTFQELLLCARMRAPRWFEAPVRDGHHPGVDALANLSRLRIVHIRSVAEWEGSGASWRCAVASLARHLVCQYSVPVFLSSAWYATDANGYKKRGWFVAHSRGAAFRSLKVPIAMTRKMERIFLASQDHLPIEAALRRAELLGLGAPLEIVYAVMSTRLGTDLRDSEFWRTVWMFLIANAPDIDTAQIGPMIDYIQAVRQDRAGNGMAAFGVPQQAFSMKGRTAQSMLRMMRDWHRSLGRGVASLSWIRSPFEPLSLEEPARERWESPRRWQMVELINSAQLRSEGTALRHCVASYADRCHRGVSSIWSLRFVQAKRINHVLTVEIDPRRRAIVQARGRANCPASGKPRRLMEEWAAREKLLVSV